MKIKNVTVAGGGVLGSQIAFQTAFKGFDVNVWLRSEGSVDRAKPRFDALKETYLSILDRIKVGLSDENTVNSVIIPRGISSDQLTLDDIENFKKDVEEGFNRIHLLTDLEKSVENCDLLIEAVSENPEQKSDFYKNLAKVLNDNTIVATNSSTLLPSSFKDLLPHPEKYLALHFANEIWNNNTAEIMGHSETSHEVYDEVVNFAKDIGMIPLKLKKEQPGYLLNSLLVPLLDAAMTLKALDIADIEDIDNAWRYGTGAPFGPFQILDVVGLKTAYNITLNKPDVNDENSVTYQIAQMLKKYIDENKLGRGTKEGFYKY